MTIKKHYFSRSAMVLALHYAFAAHAQQSTAPAATAEDAPMQTVVVLGTNIAGIKAVGTQTVTVNQEAIERSGLTNIADIARTIPQIQTTGFLREGNNSGVNSTGGQALNLRGLAPSATLLLVDGKRRTPNGTNTTYTEANQLPMIAIERVEVIPDGASAIYGSDAVAGVVNYALRKKYDGVELGVKMNDNKYFNEYGYTGIAGTSWDSLGGLPGGNVVLAIESTKRQAMVQGDSPYLRQNLTSLGGRDQRFSGTATSAAGAVGNIVVPRSTTNPLNPYAGALDYYSLPAGTNGLGLKASDLGVNTPNLLDTADYTDYIGKMKRDMLSLVAEQKIVPGLSAYVEAFYTNRTTTNRSLSTQSVTLPSATVAGAYTTNVGTPIPYYISGIPGVAAGAPLRVFYNTYKDIGNTVIRNTSKTYTITTGLKFDLSGSWKGETYFTYGNDDTCGLCTSGVNTAALQALINAGRINPLSSLPVDAATAALYTTNRVQQVTNTLRDFVVNGNGALFDIPGGTVRSAVGYEHLETGMKMSNWQNLTSNTTAFPASSYDVSLNPYVNNGPETSLTRRVDSVFGEVFAPIIGPAQKIPMVRALNLSAALRYDRYSDFGGTVNPKLSAVWEVNDQLSFRSSAGTSFRAPGLAEKNPGVTQLVQLNSSAQSTFANNSGDASIPRDANGNTTAVVLSGANPDLGPEKAKVWTVGFDYKPTRNLGLSATFYDIRYRDQIVYLNAGSLLASAQNRALYANYIEVTPVPTGCNVSDATTWNQDVRKALAGVNLTGIVDTALACSARAILNTRAQNAGATHQNGIDLTVNYKLATDVGDFAFNGSANKVLNSKFTPVPGAAVIDALDRINSVTDNFPVSLKGHAAIDWFKGMYSAGVSANFIGSYLNDRPITILGVTQAVSNVPSWTTFDLRFGLTFDDPTPAWAKGIRVNLAFLNVTDKAPPTVLSTVGAGGFDSGAMDGNNADPFGRRISLQVNKAF